MLEPTVVSPYKPSWKTVLKSGHTCKPVQRVSSVRTAVFPKSVETWIHFLIPFKQVWVRPWAEWNTETFKIMILSYRSSWARREDSLYKITHVGSVWSTFIGELDTVLWENWERSLLAWTLFWVHFLGVWHRLGIKKCWAVSIWQRVGFS